MSLIYTLADPRTGEVRYVGKTDRDPTVRVAQHVNDAKNKHTHRGNWVRSLLNAGVRPVFEAVEEVPKSEWEFWEQHWIQQFKGWGFDLVNTHKGGTGGTIAHSEETKRRIGNANRGKSMPMKWKAVFAYNLKTGAFERAFENMTVAARELGTCSSARQSLRRAVKNQGNLYGYAWSNNRMDFLVREGRIAGVTAKKHAHAVGAAAFARSKRRPMAEIVAIMNAARMAKRAARLASA